jgi:hypothetical protein
MDYYCLFQIGVERPFRFYLRAFRRMGLIRKKASADAGVLKGAWWAGRIGSPGRNTLVTCPGIGLECYRISSTSSNRRAGGIATLLDCIAECTAASPRRAAIMGEGAWPRHDLLIGAGAPPSSSQRAIQPSEGAAAAPLGFGSNNSENSSSKAAWQSIISSILS